MSFTFDLSDFQRVGHRIETYADQIPYALARALNDSAEIARKDLPQTWAEHVTVRNPNFLKAALSTRGTRATKKNLRVEVYDRLGRGSLLLHETGGTKRPRGAALAVPSQALQARRTGKGVPKGMRPRNLSNSFKKVGRYGTEVIYQRTGGKKNPGLKLMYSLQPSAPIKAEVPFHAEFGRVMRREIRHNFSIRIEQALKTALRK